LSENRTLFTSGGSPEISRWSERERDATEGEREREARRRVRGRGAGWTMDLVGALPGLREKWEREGKNERDGGK
jgi:hypothetical protein